MERPDKPSQLEERLVSMSIPVKLSVEYRQTGTDTAETFWVVTDWNKKTYEYSGGIPERYIDYRPSYNSVFSVKKEVVAKVLAWKKFETSHAHELAEYERLKKKFG